MGNAEREPKPPPTSAELTSAVSSLSALPHPAIPSLGSNPQPNLRALSLPLRLWPPILFTGAAAGLAGGLLMKLLRIVQHACYAYQSGDFLDGVRGVSGERRLLVMTCAGVLTGVALLLIRRISDSKRPGLTESIWKHNADLPARSMTAKALLSIVIVGMGAALGREAALKQSGGMIGANIAKWTRISPEHRKLLVACGVGAGMAAAYNVPFGGALFTLEVLLGTASLAAAVPAFTCSFLATAVAWLLLPNEPTYHFPDLRSTTSLLVWSVLCGPLMGFAAILFVRGVHWAKDHKPVRWGLFVMPVLIFSALGCAAIPWPALLGNGKNVVQLAIDSQIPVQLLVILLFLRPLATVACLRAGAPGGLFTPTMTCGALVGGVLGQAWSYIYPGADKRSCALIGAGAVLSAATQAPISSIAFILELTGNANTLTVPLLAAIAGATITCRHFESRTSY